MDYRRSRGAASGSPKKRSKASCSPTTVSTLNEQLEKLEQLGFIQRYEVDGNKYISIVISRSIRVHIVKKTASTIPAPGMHGASTVQEPPKAIASRADFRLLIPITPSLNPDNLDLVRSKASNRQSQRFRGKPQSRNTWGDPGFQKAWSLWLRKQCSDVEGQSTTLRRKANSTNLSDLKRPRQSKLSSFRRRGQIAKFDFKRSGNGDLSKPTRRFGDASGWNYTASRSI